MLYIPHEWQQADDDKSFVFSLNEKLTNEFCFIVQGCKKERAEQIATLACAAPLLLEALESIVKYIEDNPYDMGLESFAKSKAIAAIAAARGE